MSRLVGVVAAVMAVCILHGRAELRPKYYIGVRVKLSHLAKRYEERSARRNRAEAGGADNMHRYRYLQQRNSLTLTEKS